MSRIGDFGIVIVYKPKCFYYYGLDALGKSIRKAKIYHSERYAMEAIKSLCKKENLLEEDFEIKHVRIELLEK